MLSIEKINGTIFTSIILSNTLYLLENDTLFFAEKIEFDPKAVRKHLKPAIREPLTELATKLELLSEWQTEIMKKFPAIYDRLCRNPSQVQNGSNFSIYLRCELETYSDKTIQLYYQHVKKAVDKGRNISLAALQKLIKKGGYRDLDHAENSLKKKGKGFA